MTYDDLISALMGVLPENEGGLAIENIRFYKSENKACFSILSDQVIGERGFFAVKKALQKAFPEMKIQLRIACPARAADFVRDPDKYALPLNQLLMRECPAVRSWEFDLRWMPGNAAYGCGLGGADEPIQIQGRGGHPQLLQHGVEGVHIPVQVGGEGGDALNELRHQHEQQEHQEKDHRDEGQEVGHHYLRLLLLHQQKTVRP